jgi:hypothetical protein
LAAVGILKFKLEDAVGLGLSVSEWRPAGSGTPEWQTYARRIEDILLEITSLQVDNIAELSLQLDLVLRALALALAGPGPGLTTSPFPDLGSCAG